MTAKAFFLVFGFFWSVATCYFLHTTIDYALRQHQALSFPTTPGLVDFAELTIEHRKHTSYGIKISYHFDVNNQRYQSTRLRYKQDGASESWATAMTQQFAAGTSHNVYYNPTNPADSLLLPGIQPENLYQSMFIVPFTLLMLAIWAIFIGAIRRPIGLRGLRVIQEGPITRLRPSRIRILIASACALGASAFLSTFVLGLFFTGPDPSLRPGIIAWLTVLAITAFAALKSARTLSMLTPKILG